jgi:hypothetical protein
MQSPTKISEYADRFDSIVDVTDEGADPSGSESITPVLESVGKDHTLLYFPEGTYKMSESWENRSFENVGILGDGATIKPPQRFQGYLFALGRPGEASDLLVDGLHFDVTEPKTGARVVEGRVDDGLEVKDISVTGVQDIDFAATRFDVTSEGGSGVVERLDFPEGGASGSMAIGSYVGDTSYGDLSFVDCDIRRFPNNGLYGSSSKGKLTVEGGFYANNGIANVRVGNDAVVKDVEVRCDEAVEGFQNMRGIRLRNGSTATIRNCTIEYTEITYSDGAIVVEPWLSAATIEDTTIKIDTDDTPAIRVKPLEDDVDSADDSLTCRNVSVTGSAAKSRAIEVNNRDGCSFENVSINQTGSDRNGLFMQVSEDNELRDSVIEVPGEPIILQQAEIERINTQAIDTDQTTTSRSQP